MNVQIIGKQLMERKDYVRKQYVVDDDLYDLLLKCFTLYKGDLSDIANICIAAFVTMESFNLYVKPDNMHSTLHTFQITKQNVAALETLRNRFDISISHLFNAAIAYVLKSHNT